MARLQVLGVLAAVGLAFVTPGSASETVQGASPHGEPIPAGIHLTNDDLSWIEDAVALHEATADDLLAGDGGPAVSLQFRLTNPVFPEVDFDLQLNMEFPFINGGGIGGTICGAGDWVVRPGGFTTPNGVLLIADYTGNEACVENVLILAQRSGEFMWSGKYTWNFDTFPIQFLCDLTLVGPS